MPKPRPLRPGIRISVRGCSGSGKSTLAKELALRISGDFIELDSINHLPGWRECETEAFRRAVAERVARERWVCDGNYSKVQDLVFARADTIIWLDYSFPITFWRVVSRTLRRWATREELWNGNREVLWRQFFSRESLFLWVIQTYRKYGRQAAAGLVDPGLGDKVRIHLCHPRETAAWLSTLPVAGAAMDYAD